MRHDQTDAQALELDSRSRGHTTLVDYWRNVDAFRTDSAADPGFPPEHTRDTIIAAIKSMSVDFRHKPEPGEHSRREAMPT